MKKVLLTVYLVASLFTTIHGQDGDAFKKFPVFNFQKVTEKIFDAKAINKNEFTWRPNYAELLDFNGQVSYDGYCHTKLDTAFDFTAGETKYMMLAYSTIKYSSKAEILDCHSCAPTISVAVFKKETDNSFYLEFFKKSFTSFGGFGESGKYALEKTGKEQYALVLTSGYMGQGQYNETKTYYSLTSGLNKIFEYESENSNNNSGESEVVSLKISSVPASNYLYDFILTTKKNGKVLPLKKKFSFNGEAGFYLPVK